MTNLSGSLILVITILFAILGIGFTRSIPTSGAHPDRTPIGNQTAAVTVISPAKGQITVVITGKVVESGFLDDQRFLVIQIPEEMDGAYYGKIDETIIPCTRQEPIPTHLYCFDRIPDPKKSKTLMLISKKDGTIEMRVEIPESNEH